MVEAREGKDLAKLASRHLEEKYGCMDNWTSFYLNNIVVKKACHAAMWSHLSEGKSTFEDDLKEKNAESPNVNLRSHLVRWILFVLGQASENNKIFTLIEVSPSQSLTSLGAIQVLHKIFLSVRHFLFEKNLEDPMMEN